MAAGIREDRRDAPGDEETGRGLLCVTGRIHERPCGAHAEGTRRQERARAARRMESVGERG